MDKRLLVLICLIGISLFLGISFVSAQCAPPPVSGLCKDYCDDPCDPVNNPFGHEPIPGKLCICPPTAATTVEALLDNVINYIFWFATAITPILVLVGGFMFMTSGGSIEKVATAKRILTYTIIGYAIILFARGLVYVLVGLLS